MPCYPRGFHIAISPCSQLFGDEAFCEENEHYQGTVTLLVASKAQINCVQLIEIHSDLTARSWLCDITTTEVQQKPLMLLVPPPLTPGCPKAQLSNLRAATKCSTGASPRTDWQRDPGICPPSICNTEYHRWTGGGTITYRMPWYKSPPALQRPLLEIRNFKQLDRFLLLSGQMQGLKNVKYSMAAMTQLQQHINSKTKLTYKQVILFCLHFCYELQEKWTVDSCREQGQHQENRHQIVKNHDYSMWQLEKEISILGVY